jgi:hypothetical protein
MITSRLASGIDPRWLQKVTRYISTALPHEIHFLDTKSPNRWNVVFEKCANQIPGCSMQRSVECDVTDFHLGPFTVRQHLLTWSAVLMGFGLALGFFSRSVSPKNRTRGVVR